jgi:hypothetical protein
MRFRVEPPVPQGGDVRFDLRKFILLRVRRVALAEPRLPYAKILRPVGAKSRTDVVDAGEDSI